MTGHREARGAATRAVGGLWAAVEPFVGRKARKAVTGFLGAFLGATGAAALDGSLTGSELVAAFGVGLTTAAAVWKVRNAR